MEGLLRCADVALYSAKDTRGTHALYDRHTDQHSAALLGLQADLRAALEDPDDQQISVVYQPQLDLHTGRVSAVECLVRWRHPELGNLMPGQLHPDGREHLAHRPAHAPRAATCRWPRSRLGRARACTCRWRSTCRPASSATSPCPTPCSTSLQRHDLAPDRLLLEVTESRLMSDPERSVQILSRLQALGVALSIDDFGTGYSSLAYLQRLAVDELKIDKSFILRAAASRATPRSCAARSSSATTSACASSPRASRTRHSADALAGMGCDMLQGYFIGRPTVAADLRALLLAAPQVAARPRARRARAAARARPAAAAAPTTRSPRPPAPPTEPGDP